jgi:hypothetical protein
MANIPLIEDVKADLVRRLDAGEITKEQAQVAAQNYKTRYQNQPIQRGPEQVDKFAKELKEKVTIGQMRPDEAADALRTFQFGVSGRQTPEQSRGMGGHFQFPIVPKPEGVTDKEFLVDPEQKTSVSLIDRVMEQFSGKLRTTDRIKGKPSYVQLPELNKLTDPKAFWATLSMSSAGVPEMVSIIKSQFPEVDVEFDKKGNPIITSAEDGQEYVIHPGLEASDIVRAATELGLSFTGAKALGALRGIKALGKGAQMLDKGGRLGRGMAAGAAEQAGFEGMQASAGGSFDWGDIALNAGVGGTSELAGGALKRLFGKRKPSTVGGPDFEPTKENITDLAKDSVKAAKGGEKAVRKFFAQFDADEQLIEDFKILGIEDVPPDLITKDIRAKASAGLGRSVADSEQEGAFISKVSTMANRMDDALEELGATYAGLEGKRGPSPSDVSDKIFDDINTARKGLADEARVLYEEVESIVPPSAPASFENTKALIQETLGKRNKSLLDPQEKKLLSLVDENLTYDDLKGLKEKLRTAKIKKDLFPTVSSQRLDDMADAVRADELATVEILGDADLSSKAREANKLWVEKKNKDDKLKAQFGLNKLGSGDDIELLKGSIAQDMSSMITQASRNKGADPTKMVRLLEGIPGDDLKKEALLTGIADAGRATKGLGKNKVGFLNFSNLWSGINRTTRGRDAIKKVLGEDGYDFLSSMARASESIAESADYVYGTGKANQALRSQLASAMEADGLMASTISAAQKIPFMPGKSSTDVARKLSEMTNSGSDVAKKSVGNLWNSLEVQKIMADHVKNNTPIEKTANRLSYNKAFRNFMKEINEPSKPSELKEWIIRSTRAAARDENQVGEQNKN